MCSCGRHMKKKPKFHQRNRFGCLCVCERGQWNRGDDNCLAKSNKNSIIGRQSMNATTTISMDGYLAVVAGLLLRASIFMAHFFRVCLPCSSNFIAQLNVHTKKEKGNESIFRTQKKKKTTFFQLNTRSNVAINQFNIEANVFGKNPCCCCCCSSTLKSYPEIYY